MRLSLIVKKDGTFFMGQFGRIRREPSGVPHSEWIDTIPNDGIIYYTSAFNSERVFITSPKSLAEVLTQKSYTFIKPRQIAKSVGQFLGLGKYYTCESLHPQLNISCHAGS